MSAYWLVMPAAGSGHRFGSRKQHAELAGRTVLQIALQLFVADARCRGGSVVLAAEDCNNEQLRGQVPARFVFVAGGAERARSVYNGLVALESRAQTQDWVLVHDAARPCLSARDLDRLLEAGASEPVGALLATPVADTVKMAERPSTAAGPSGNTAQRPVHSSTTVAREGLWLAQTPQMFRYQALRAALEAAAAAGRVPTDEAQAIEWMGGSVRLVAAYDGNFKITRTADLALAAAVLEGRGDWPCA